MKKYLIKIEETLSKTILVEAGSLDEAIDKVNRAYRNYRIVLNADDFDAVNVTGRQAKNFDKKDLKYYDKLEDFD